MAKNEYKQITNNEEHNLVMSNYNEDLQRTLNILDQRLSQKTFKKLITNMFSDIQISYPGTDPISLQVTNDIAHVMDNREPIAVGPDNFVNAYHNLLSNISKLIKIAKIKLFGD